MSIPVKIGEQNCDWRAIHAFQRKQKKERKGSFGKPLLQFPPLFAGEGWIRGQGVPAVYVANDADRAEATQDRKEFLDYLKSNPSEQFPIVLPLDGSDNLARYGTFAEARAWLIEQNWADFPIQVVSMDHYRRNYALPLSAYAYATLNNGQEFSIDVDEYQRPASDFDEAMLRWQENRLEGREAYSDAGLLAIMVSLVDKGFGETEAIGVIWGRGEAIRKQNRGTAQKYHKLAILANRHPELNILDRCQMDAPSRTEEMVQAKVFPYSEHGYIPLKSIDKTDLGGLIGGMDGKKPPTASDRCLEAFKLAGVEYKPGERAPSYVVESYFAVVCGSKKKNARMMARENIGTKLNALGDKDSILYRTLSAVYADDGNALADLSVTQSRSVLLDKPIGLTGDALKGFMVEVNALHSVHLAKAKAKPDSAEANADSTELVAHGKPATKPDSKAKPATKPATKRK